MSCCRIIFVSWSRKVFNLLRWLVLSWRSVVTDRQRTQHFVLNHFLREWRSLDWAQVYRWFSTLVLLDRLYRQFYLLAFRKANTRLLIFDWTQIQLHNSINWFTTVAAETHLWKFAFHFFYLLLSLLEFCVCSWLHLDTLCCIFVIQFFFNNRKRDSNIFNFLLLVICVIYEMLENLFVLSTFCIEHVLVFGAKT